MVTDAKAAAKRSVQVLRIAAAKTGISAFIRDIRVIRGKNSLSVFNHEERGSHGCIELRGLQSC